MPTLTVVTWNLFGLEERHLDERMEAACFHLLMEAPPDVLLFQEVVDRSLRAHLLPHLRAAGYAVAPSEPVSDSHYYGLVAVGPALRPEAAWRRPFPGSAMGRALLGIDAHWGDRSLRVCTAHLESLRPGAAQRQAQTRAVVDALGEVEGLALFGGDTNLREPVEPLLAAGGVRDAWEVGGRPDAAAVTWWAPGRRRPRTGPRFDRFWVRDGLRVVSLDAGDGPAVQGGRISDHRYLRLTVAVG